MFVRILFITAIILQASGCIATPRLFSQVDEDYEISLNEDKEMVQRERIIASPNVLINNQISNDIRQKF